MLPDIPRIGDIISFGMMRTDLIPAKVIMTNIIGAICSYIDSSGHGRYKMVKWEDIIVEVPHGCISSPSTTE